MIDVINTKSYFSNLTKALVNSPIEYFYSVEDNLLVYVQTKNSNWYRLFMEYTDTCWNVMDEPLSDETLDCEEGIEDLAKKYELVGKSIHSIEVESFSYSENEPWVSLLFSFEGGSTIRFDHYCSMDLSHEKTIYIWSPNS